VGRGKEYRERRVKSSRRRRDLEQEVGMERQREVRKGAKERREEEL